MILHYLHCIVMRAVTSPRSVYFSGGACLLRLYIVLHDDVIPCSIDPLDIGDFTFYMQRNPFFLSGLPISKSKGEGNESSSSHNVVNFSWLYKQSSILSRNNEVLPVLLLRNNKYNFKKTKGGFLDIIS